MKNFKTKILKLVDQYQAENIKIRRHLHANPELSFHEIKTAKFIKVELEKIGIIPQIHVGGHGLVAIIKGEKKEMVW